MATPTIEVYSRETIVDVTVTDKNGKPVRGLTRADFTVQEDGDPEPIRSFQEFGAEGAVAQRVAESAEKLPPHVYSNRQAAATRGALNIIVMDAVNVGPMNLMRAKKEATDYLKKMPAGTQVALFSLGNELKFVQGFTTDREVLITALNDMKNTVMPAGSATGLCPDGTAAHLTVEAMLQIGALVEHAPGRKNVLWFTGEKSALPGEGCAESAAKRIMYEEALAILASARVSVFAIDASGLVNPKAPQSAEFGLSTPASMIPNSIPSEVSGKWVNRVAVETGGRIFTRSNDFQGEIGQALEMGTNYYSISYVPAHGNDGNFYHVSVKVNRPGLTLLYRSGYGADDIEKIAAGSGIPTPLDATTPDPKKNTMVASMARFAPVATQVLFDVKVDTTTAKPRPTDAAVMGFPVAAVKDKPMVRYNILFSVPAEQVAFTETDGVYSGKLEFDVVASDVFGKLMTSVSRTVPLILSAGEYGDFVAAPFKFSQQIDLPAGQAYVRVGVLDKVSNKVGTVEIPVMVVKGNGIAEAGR
jgi:VWFA-related protein